MPTRRDVLQMGVLTGALMPLAHPAKSVQAAGLMMNSVGVRDLKKQGKPASDGPCCHAYPQPFGRVAPSPIDL